MASETVWRETRMRVGHMLKNKQRALVPVFVSDDAPGLCVRVAQMVDTGYKGHSLPMYDGSQVITINHGHTIGPTFFGERYAFTAARQFAACHDWTTYDGSSAEVSEELLEKLRAIKAPLAEQSGKDYQAFIAQHRENDDAQHAENVAAINKRFPQPEPTDGE